MSAIVTPIKGFVTGAVGGNFNVELIRTFHALDIPGSFLGSNNGTPKYAIEFIYNDHTRQRVFFASAATRNIALTNLKVVTSGAEIAIT